MNQGSFAVPNTSFSILYFNNSATPTYLDVTGILNLNFVATATTSGPTNQIAVTLVPCTYYAERFCVNTTYLRLQTTGYSLVNSDGQLIMVNSN